jgi:DNA-binding protein HU-beta
MNKQEFIESLAVRCDVTKAESGRALDAILDSLTQAMADGEDVRFTGFGTFSSQRRRARESVNPQDPSQKIRIRAAHVPKFKPGTSLRAAASEVDPSKAESSEDRLDGRQDRNERPAAVAESGAGARAHGWVPLEQRD